ncbi:hypothetical protein GCM10010348_78520 [Streptomyces anthocyanicus]|nr:hypothetical protein GCM10010348_78520 [Streptomyces anthocyanicus]
MVGRSVGLVIVDAPRVSASPGVGRTAAGALHAIAGYRYILLYSATWSSRALPAEAWRGRALYVPGMGDQKPVVDPTRPVYAWQQVADWIARRIEGGELLPGARLEGEREMAEQAGVAVGTVRRAVEDLRQRGLVVTLPAKGTYIADRSADS